MHWLKYLWLLVFGSLESRERWQEWYIVHRIKTEWIFSGVATGYTGRRDLGFTRSPHPMRRSQALKFLRKLQPEATVIHIDDRFKIVTFSVTE